MKCKEVRITLFPADALRAGMARLANEEDLGVTTKEQAEAYQGSTFLQNDADCKDLHVVYRDGLACVNFIDERGERRNYDYPIAQLKRISHVAG